MAYPSIPTQFGTHSFVTVNTGGAYWELREEVDGSTFTVHANHITRAECRSIVAARVRAIRRAVRKLAAS